MLQTPLKRVCFVPRAVGTASNAAHRTSLKLDPMAVRRLSSPLTGKWKIRTKGSRADVLVLSRDGGVYPRVAEFDPEG